MKDRAETLKRFDAWWRGESQGLPLMYIRAEKEPGKKFPRPDSVEDFYTNIDYLMARFEQFLENSEYFADAYPSFGADLGPGSVALYLGAEPDFRWDTVWYKECMEDIAEHPKLAFDAKNHWWLRHLRMMQYAKEVSRGRFLVDIPDLIENIDILAAMRGPQNMLYDIMDEPDTVKGRIAEIDETYFRYYDELYDLLKEPDGACGYTCFHIQGTGRVAKIQCDFSAMLSPGQFREFVIPSLQKQVKRLDKSLYHLDGPDAIRHVPALMELKELNALQWTCGAGQPDGGCERWYPIYDDVAKAGKCLWIQLYDGDVNDWIGSAERLMNRYDKRKIYFVMPDMSVPDAEILMKHAENHWI